MKQRLVLILLALMAVLAVSACNPVQWCDPSGCVSTAYPGSLG